MISVTCFLCIGLLVPVYVHGTATFADCGGPDKSIDIKEGSVKPDPILYPGNVNPRKMNVPCLDNIGSCSYDVCELIQNHRSEFCPMFKNPDECGCPMKAGYYSLKNAPVVLPDFGEIFVKILKGHYEGNITFTDKNSNKQVGCIAITFEIEPSS
ncbi:Ganglioside GM2 activator like protein [Argiope bruennichi]|uniref:Ganglioside GM2 activator like protein n=1 Tax=Argiope bruennichi TaxID=94029 RepID=A0A8T0F4X0_ARGBR|nr:Ganglioside GM2 activator like protein [Argiope bruennichi]